MTETLTLTPHEHVRIRRADPSALEVEVTYDPGGSRPPGHLHPDQAERFEVLSGVICARVDGVEQRLVAGDTLAIDPGVVHQMWNDGEQPARAIWLTRPAGRTLEWFRQLDALHQPGGPGLRLTTIAPLLTKYADVMQLSARPRGVVRVALRVVARWRLALAAAVLLAVALAVPAVASGPGSIAYIKDHNVWVAAPDGSVRHQLTRDGTAGWRTGRRRRPTTGRSSRGVGRTSCASAVPASCCRPSIRRTRRTRPGS